MRLICFTLLTLSSTATQLLADPAPAMVPRLEIRSVDNFGFPTGSASLFESAQVLLGETAVLASNSPGFFSDVRFSYTFSTEGNVRTLTQIWESVDDSFMTPDAFSHTFPTANEGNGSEFSISTSPVPSPMDSDWDGTNVLTRRIFSGDGQIISDFTSNPSFFPTGSTTNSFGNPGQSDWLGGSAALDRIERIYVYTVVPTPSSATLLAFAGIGLVSRRRN